VPSPALPPLPPTLVVPPLPAPPALPPDPAVPEGGGADVPVPSTVPVHASVDPRNTAPSSVLIITLRARKKTEHHD
jgi:hypothetical protein